MPRETPDELVELAARAWNEAGWVRRDVYDMTVTGARNVIDVVEAERDEARAQAEALAVELTSLRFQLRFLLDGAEALGDSMDAPVRFRTDVEAHLLSSLRSYLERTDAVLRAYRESQEPDHAA